MPEPVWGVVANIVQERPYVEGGAEIRIGTKHFNAGAKVYLVEVYWGAGGDQLTVVGHHRQTHRFVTMDVSAAWLTNWRVSLIYSPHIIAEFRNYLRRFYEEEIVARKKPL